MASEIPSDVFIDAVRKQPCIYDKRHVNYKSRLMREEAWRTIIHEFGGEFSVGNVDTIKMRWRSLKDSYLKHKRANNGLLNSILTKQYKNWRWASYMSFLDPHISVKGAPIPYRKNNIRFRPQKSKVIKKEVTDEYEKNSESNQKFSEVFLNVPQGEEEEVRKKDDIYHLFASYAETFRRFAPKRQVMLKMELANLFVKAEMEHLDEMGCSGVHNNSSDQVIDNDTDSE